MRNSELKKLVSVAGRILLAFVFVFSQSAWAGQDQKTKDKASARKASAQQAQEKQAPVASANAQSEEAQNTAAARNAAEESSVAEEKPSGDGSREGIKVHGHWTIEVRNPDGSLVSHREFENSLATGANGSGSSVLSSILGRANSVGLWDIHLGGSICGTSSAPGPCELAEPGGGTSPAIFNTLSVGVNAGKVVLAGTATAQIAGAIVEVDTIASVCPPSNPPSSPCLNHANFTVAFLGTPISVSAGQIVQVQVAISFS
jgi:hypothetical protein